MARLSAVATLLVLLSAMSLRVDGRPDFCGTGPKYGAWRRIGVGLPRCTVVWCRRACAGGREEWGAEGLVLREGALSPLLTAFERDV